MGWTANAMDFGVGLFDRMGAITTHLLLTHSSSQFFKVLGINSIVKCKFEEPFHLQKVVEVYVN